ncbi:MAG: isopentenyl-diphosphate delta-isomerase [Saprospiraceae bacterium]
MDRNPDEIPSNSGDTMSSRKKDHIELAFQSKVSASLLDDRFYYEPVLASHPNGEDLSIDFLNKKFKAPIWISSMTGGTEKAAVINCNLAKACKQFGLGMGLGSCRQLLTDDTYFSDFNVRKWMDDQPLYANLGIAQVEYLIENGKLAQVVTLVDRLEADGIIIHINPTQEWLQPEGDRIKVDPIETIKRALDKINKPIIIKEVGQGMGPHSLMALMSLPLEAIDFGAGGGTNFALLEILRTSKSPENLLPLAKIGHHAMEMISWVNTLAKNEKYDIICKQFIVSGGITTFLDGFYAIRKMQFPSIYGQGSAFLKPALESYEALEIYISEQIQGLQFANKFLKLKSQYEIES